MSENLSTLTPRQQMAMGLYTAIMEEIKIRISAVDTGTGGLLPNLPPQIVSEHCFLQIRLICELIALACLVAHGDIEGTHVPKLQKEWKADKIMGGLEKLHRDFYPRAILRIPRTDGLSGYHIELVNPSPCPKAELLRIYGRCGDALHRGNLRKLMRPGETIEPVHYPSITALLQKIVNLLNDHLVMTLNRTEVFFCVFRNRDDNFKTQVVLGQMLSGPAPEF